MKRWMTLAAVAALVACGKANTVAPPSAPAAVAPAPAHPAGAMAVAAPADPLRPEVVLDKLHNFDAQLIEASELASKSAHSHKVKKLAKELFTARKHDEAELTAVASKLSVTLKDPAQLPLAPADKAELGASQQAFAALSTQRGAGFDADFLASVDGALKSELLLLGQVSAKASNAELRSMATALEPEVSAREKATEKDLKPAGHAKSAG